MARVIVQPDAERDLDEIRTTTRERWGDEQARRYRALILNAIEEIARHPRIGLSRNHVRPGVFAFPIRRQGNRGRHLVFYRLTPSTVEILRILHESRDFARQLSIRILKP